MEKSKKYKNVYFTPEVYMEALSLFRKNAVDDETNEYSKSLSVDSGMELWRHDNIEEFFADYRKDPSWSTFGCPYNNVTFRIETRTTFSEVTIGAQNRSTIESVFSVFEKAISKDEVIHAKVEEKIEPTIFIGHGHSQQWRDLKDHLADHHHYKVQAYEVGARAGHCIRDILEDMIKKSSFACLIMTGDDEDSKGNKIARQNVIHEIGLFQGNLGFSRAIVLLEEGTEKFSNIDGIHQLRFSKGNIKEVFGDVLATLRREFGN